MPSGTSDQDIGAPCPDGDVPLRKSARNGLKIVVIGGFGVGKTTLVRSVSEIRPLRTEETMTEAGVGVDSLDEMIARTKSSTTVAFDFGRITLNDQMVLYLFGAPGQDRFWFLWNRLFSGTLGAVVLVDSRRLDESWYAIDRLEHHGTPFIVARNTFGTPTHSLAEVRQALDLADHVPLVDCDARQRESSKSVLISLVNHLYARAAAARLAGPGTSAPGTAAPGAVGSAPAGPTPAGAGESPS